MVTLPASVRYPRTTGFFQRPQTTIKALRESGAEIPDDMSIVVLDDLQQGRIRPFLTVISQPAHELGGHRSPARPHSTSAQPAPAGVTPMEDPA
jgi:hypothetical protein